MFFLKIQYSRSLSVYYLISTIHVIIIHQIFSLARDWSKHVMWPNIPQKNWGISEIIIHQIFSLTCDWSKRVTWPNIPQLKLWNILEYSPILKIARVAKKIWRIIKTIASIWGENMLGYLSLDIICSSKLLEQCCRKTVRFSEQMTSADKYPRIFLRQMEVIVYL